MSLKNAIKILINRFGIVFSILVFILIFGTIIVSLSIAFIHPILNALESAGLYDAIRAFFDIEQFSLKYAYDSFEDIVLIIKEVFLTNVKVKINSSLFIVLVVVFAYRLLLGYYELPSVNIIEAKMSSNAKIGFLGGFVSYSKLSTRFIFAKMLYTIIADIINVAIIHSLTNLWGINAILSLFIPFITIAVFIMLQALRYSVIALWSPSVWINKGKIVSSFKLSVRQFFKNFKVIYGNFIIAWLLIFVMNVLIGLITLGAGLLLTIPISMAFISCLNMTLYYELNGMKYYVDNTPHQPH